MKAVRKDNFTSADDGYKALAIIQLAQLHKMNEQMEKTYQTHKGTLPEFVETVTEQGRQIHMQKNRIIKELESWLSGQ